MRIRQRRRQVTLGAAVGEGVEVAAQCVRRGTRPIERQQRGGKQRIAQQDAPVGVDQHRAHDEALLRIVGAVAGRAEALDDRAEALQEAAVVCRQQ